jgi:purine-binding chemotaxis protein CheW
MENEYIDRESSYINFKIGNENFAISVYKVLEIIQFEQITQIPNASDFIRGVINFRGSIVPVINMHKRFNIGQQETESRMVIIVDVKNRESNVIMGLLVDQVVNVVEFNYKSIRVLPDLGIRYNPEFLEGFVDVQGQFIMIMNVDRVLSVNELSALTENTVIEK